MTEKNTRKVRKTPQKRKKGTQRRKRNLKPLLEAFAVIALAGALAGFGVGYAFGFSAGRNRGRAQEESIPAQAAGQEETGTLDDRADTPKAQEETEGLTDSADTPAAQEETEGLPDPAGTLEAQAGMEMPVDARSSFAVQPGVLPGSSQQSEEKVVYLTLDDGPSQNTIQILDILDRYHAKATFFVTNEAPEYAYLIKEAYDRGHTIGLHTYSHDYAAIYASVEAYFADLDAIGELVRQQIGYVPCFIRFPGGSSNSVSAKYTPGIMTVLAQEVQNRGYQYYDWNCSSGDGGNCTTPELIQNATKGSANNIVLLSHDASEKGATVEALPSIIEYYQSQGYEFRALDRETFTAHHTISN